MGWLTRILPRPAQPLPPPCSAECWVPGDLAECLHDGQWFLGGRIPASGPHAGEVLKIAAIVDSFDAVIGGTGEFLCFARFGKPGFPSRLFRRVVPRADALERAEPAFAALIARPVTAPETVS